MSPSDPALAVAAPFSAGLFALHPLRVESVAWATERRDVVCGFFYLLAVLAHVAAVEAAPGARRLRLRIASVAAFGLARRALGLVAEKVPYLALSAAFGIVALAATLLALGRRRPALLAAGLAYAASLLPVLGIAQVWRQFVAERYSYIACLGIALLGGGALLEIARRRGAPSRPARVLLPVAAPALALLVLLAALTARQVRVWRDSKTLWRAALAVDPDNYVALNNLAIELTRKLKFDEANAAYTRACGAPRRSPARSARGSRSTSVARLSGTASAAPAVRKRRGTSREASPAPPGAGPPRARRTA